MKKIFLLFFITISTTSFSQTVGLIYNYPGSLDGYILFAPGSSDTTYLIDKCGKRIHQWQSEYYPGLAVYLLSDGNLLRCGNLMNQYFIGGGQGGIIERFDWNNNLLWSYQISDNSQCQHHDAIQLPNGNVLAIVWEDHDSADAHSNGRTSLGTHMWSEKLVELQPIGADSGIIVWQWDAWDHLVQDADNTKLNYGVVEDHPELININLGTLNDFVPDWLHFNGLDYDSVLDQIIVSSRAMSEVYIIDHSTTMSESATHSGGNAGHGGDFLYRWGNPYNYGRGTLDDQKLFQQHNPSWVPEGFPGAGKILVFNNGLGRPGTDYSTVETFMLPPIDNYNYKLVADSAYLPDMQDWIYADNPVTDLFSFSEGGAQRLPNGNTLICNATAGGFLEIDSAGNDQWKYINPVTASGIATQGDFPQQNSLFRATFISSQYPGLAGQSLIPGNPIELNPLNYICENFPTAAEQIKFDNAKLAAYPNPFQGSFAIHVPIEVKNATLQIHDVTGRLLYEEKNLYAGPQSDVFISAPQYKGMMLISVKDASANHFWDVTIVGL